MIQDNIVSVIADIDVLKSKLKKEYDKTLTDTQRITSKILTLREIYSQLEASETV